MIAFDLVCSNGHRFECWFRDGASFEEQKVAGMINCPVCHDDDVEKVFSSVTIRKHRDGKKAEMTAGDVFRLVQEYVDKNFEDVGLDFTKEALKIHYGDAEKRNIKGVTTPPQEKLLKEEGVQFFKIPIVKRLDN